MARGQGARWCRAQISEVVLIDTSTYVQSGHYIDVGKLPDGQYSIYHGEIKSERIAPLTMQ